MTRRTPLGLLAAAIAAAGLATVPAVARAHVADEVRSDADWILQAQLPDGAIATQIERTAISPYLSNFAAVGLARAAQLTGDPRYADAAWRWLSWYRAHQDRSGFVTDYAIAGGQPSSARDMDSTDAYAGTFLMAAGAAWQATGDVPRLRELEPGVVAAVAAIEATQRPDGLTWAKPAAHVKYLMDQAEAYAGARSAVAIARALANAALRRRAAAIAVRLHAGVRRLWNPRRGAYDWAVHPGGVRQPTNWRVLYPDALQQAWAVAFGLAGGARARGLMRRFAREQPRWDQPASIARFRSRHRAVGYWAPAAWAFARVAELRRSRLAARRIRRAAIGAGRAWPFTVADAGQLVVLADPSRDALTRLLGP